jgi:hypothetical protein
MTHDLHFVPWQLLDRSDLPFMAGIGHPSTVEPTYGTG